MKKLSILFFLIVTIGASNTKDLFTAQYPDKIRFKGKEYNLHVNPLEAYFEKFPEKRPKTEIMSSALWRGYIAYFGIFNNQLYVTDIKIQVKDEKSQDRLNIKLVSVYDQVFPNSKKFKVDSYSGILILPYGKLISYVHLAYGSTYSNYWLIETQNGLVSETRNYNNEEFVQFKKDQFKAFQKTQAYKTLYKELKEYFDEDENIDDFIYQHITKYITSFLYK